MAMRRPVFTTSDKSSPVAATRGAALAAELCTAAFPESQDKRREFLAHNLTASAGTTPVELTCDGAPGFRFRLAQSSIVAVRGNVVYISSATRESWTINATYTNINGTIAAVGTPSVAKTGATTAVFAITTDNATEALVLTGTGVAGDTSGYWMVDFDINEVTEIG